jgi:branched-chain amino acid aminotransferase
VGFSSWRRISDNTIPARCKVTGGYVNSALARTEAIEQGYDEAIFLTQDGFVSEGSAENIFLARNGSLITPDLSQDILEGITRDVLLTLCREELGLTVTERQVGRTELYVADEVFLCGTGAQVSPVIEVDRRPVGSGKMGPITARIQQLYFQAVKGDHPKYRHWCTPVY